MDKSKLERNTKESSEILYSTKVLKQGKEPKIHFTELFNNKGDNIGTIIFEYNTPQGIPQQAIMGIIGNTSDRRRKAFNIIELIKKQLNENKDRHSEYNCFRELERYIKRNDIPFKFTQEGNEILNSKSEEEIPIKRTIFENERGRLGQLPSNHREEKTETVLETYVRKEINKEEQGDFKEYIVVGLPEEEQRHFSIGQKIAHIMQRTEVTYEDNKKTLEIKNKFKEKVVSNYLLKAYASHNGYDDMQSAKIILLNEYIKVKEKGLAKDAKSILDTLEENLYKKMSNEGQENKKDLDTIKILDKYIKFFNLLENGRDVNARIYALKIEQIDFNNLRNIITTFDEKDEELLKYLYLKEMMIQETKTHIFYQGENKYPSVRQLYKFLVNSSTRECVKNEDESLVEKIFEQYKTEILKRNEHAIELYNRYARRHGLYICPTSTNKTKSMHIDVPGEEENDGNR